MNSSLRATYWNFFENARKFKLPYIARFFAAPVDTIKLSQLSIHDGLGCDKRFSGGF